MRLVGAGFDSHQVLYDMTLFDLNLALEGLQWRNIELLQALRLNTLAAIAPYSKNTPELEELYPLVTDSAINDNGGSGGDIERVKQRFLEATGKL